MGDGSRGLAPRYISRRMKGKFARRVMRMTMIREAEIWKVW